MGSAYAVSFLYCGGSHPLTIPISMLYTVQATCHQHMHSLLRGGTSRQLERLDHSKPADVLSDDDPPSRICFKCWLIACFNAMGMVEETVLPQSLKCI